MGFFDRFRKPKSAEEAINNLDNESFQKVVRNLNAGKIWVVKNSLKVDSEYDIVEAVKKRLTVQNLLIVAMTDDEKILKKFTHENHEKDVRIAAVNKIDDIPFLLDVAKSEKSHDVLKAILDKIDDESLLFEIAMNFRYDISQYNHDPFTRYKAIEKITDDDLIYRIIKESKEHKIRSRAAGCIHDVDYAIKILKDRTVDESIRRVALFKLSDEKTLEYLSNSRDNSMRIHAVGHIKDKNLLRDVLNDLNYSLEIRSKALESIEDEEMLKEILRDTTESSYKMIILKKLADSEISKDYIFDPSPDVRKAAASNIDDVEILLGIAKNDEDEWVGRAAVSNIDDVGILREIVADKSINCKVREKALTSRLDDRFLKNLVMDGENECLYRDAIKKICDEDVLAYIALNSESSDLSRACAKRIRRKDLLKMLHSKLAFKTCPECGSYDISYSSDFYSYSTDLFLAGYKCYRCGHEFELTMK